jgi:hypothetical protein
MFAQWNPTKTQALMTAPATVLQTALGDWNKQRLNSNDMCRVSWLALEAPNFGHKKEL